MSNFVKFSVSGWKGVIGRIMQIKSSQKLKNSIKMVWNTYENDIVQELDSIVLHLPIAVNINCNQQVRIYQTDCKVCK